MKFLGFFTTWINPGKMLTEFWVLSFMTANNKHCLTWLYCCCSERVCIRKLWSIVSSPTWKMLLHSDKPHTQSTFLLINVFQSMKSVQLLGCNQNKTISVGWLSFTWWLETKWTRWLNRKTCLRYSSKMTSQVKFGSISSLQAFNKGNQTNKTSQWDLFRICLLGTKSTILLTCSTWLQLS